VLYDFSITFWKLLVDLISACKSTILRRGHYPIYFHIKNIYKYCLLKVTPNISLVHSKLSNLADNSDSNISNLKTAFSLISAAETDWIFCKLDIEGFEYELIEELAFLEHQISGLVVEFHNTFAMRETFIRSLRQLKSNYAVVQTHVNNYGGIAADGQPVVFEITFLNRRFLAGANSTSPNESLVSQDQPNNPDSAEVNLTFN
jgi:hypothetical protein